MFDIFRQEFLDYLAKSNAYKIRIYLLRGLNLSAQADATELRDRLAGLDAFCSANSFPIIVVGNGENKGFDVLKQVNDRTNSVDKNLNPNYFRSYELDSSFPNDWKLEILIKDKGSFSDSLVGGTVIDLEDRLLGQAESKQSIAYEVWKEIKENAYHEIEHLDRDEEKGKLLEDSTRIATKADTLQKNFKSPVEYRALRHPKKNTSQGTIEMFLEILSGETGTLSHPD